MPNAVKISELPQISSVQPNDLIPVVDEAITQTHRCRASQIAAIGGGPPGVNTVSTDKLQNGAVTYPKIQNVTADRILGRATAGAGVVEEIPCTAFGRAWLAYADAIAAANGLTLQLFTSPTFTGQIKTDRGTVTSPAYTFTPDPTTGIFSPDAGAVSITTDGRERLRINTDGDLLMPYDGVGPVRYAAPARAWCNFNGLVGGTQTINRASQITTRYGLLNTGVANSLWNEQNTRDKIRAMELAGGIYTLNENNISSVAGDGRTNYTTPGDNKHWYWNTQANNGAGGWAQISASGRPWIGSITLTTAATNYIRQAANIVAVQRINTGIFRVFFESPLPADAAYCVVASASDHEAQTWATTVGIGAQTSSYFELYCMNTISGATFNPRSCHVAVFR